MPFTVLLNALVHGRENYASVPKLKTLLACLVATDFMVDFSLVPRRSPPLTGEREIHVRAWERVGVPAQGQSVTSRNYAPN